MLASVSVVAPLAGNGADHLAVADHRDGVGDVQDLVELVRDKHHAVARRRVLALEKVKEFVGLAGGEHRRRLVENQDACAPVEGFENLDFLLHPDGQILDAGVGVQAKVKLLDQFGHPLSCPRVVDGPAFGGFAAQNHVLGDGQRLDQHEVLKDHPDAELDGVGGVVQFDDLPVDHDLAGGGRLSAVDDLDQGGFARAVLAAQRVDAAPLDFHRDAVVGQHQRKAFGDLAQFERVLGAVGGRRGHAGRAAGHGGSLAPGRRSQQSGLA